MTLLQHVIVHIVIYVFPTGSLTVNGRQCCSPSKGIDHIQILGRIGQALKLFWIQILIITPMENFTKEDKIVQHHHHHPLMHPNAII